LIRCEEISVLSKNEFKQEVCSDFSDRVATTFPIAYLTEYSTKFLQGFWDDETLA